jgi:exodeoxyribonuclease V alpha subunit
LGGVLIIAEKILEFKAMPTKCLFNGDNYKIYACSVNSFTYPDVKIGKYGTASIKGDIQELNIGCEYLIKGEEVQDKYGYGYNVMNIRAEKPNTIESSRNFLREILTWQQADTLISVYPDIIDRIMTNKLDDIDLNKTKGIKEYTFNVIKKKVIENFKLAELVDEFSGIFSISIIKKLYSEYTSIQKIRENLHSNPYECLCKLGGVGFKTADELLNRIDAVSKRNMKEGKKPILDFQFELLTSFQRMKACALYVLDENENAGNTYMSLKMFQKECLTYAKEAANNLVPVIKSCDEIFFDKNTLRISKRQTYETELYIADRLLNGLSCNRVWDIDISKYRTIENSELTDDQMKTMEYVCKNNIVILQGYAGSGKSFSSKALINLLNDNNKSSLLLAPTGRASKVLQGYTGHAAMTIHRGLAFMPPNEWRYNKDNPLFYDMVILDETSMTDVFLFKHLLEAIDFNRTKLLLIGDDAQIPSVSCGNLLYDLLNSGKIPTVYLTKVFRYGIGGLSTVATDIRKSTLTFDKDKDGIQVVGEDKGLTLMPMIQEKAVDYIVKMYQKLLSNGISLDDILILSSQNVGNYGTQIINNAIQEAVNPDGDYVKYGDVEYRKGDPIIQCVNDYKAINYRDGEWNEEDTTFISNGEIGRITEVMYSDIVVDFNGVHIIIPKTKFQNIKLGYAISIHKSQGGQCKHIIVFAPKAHTFMLNSNLLYVAVTRAKERCYLITDINTYSKAIKKKENFDRKTWLCDLLIKEELNG